MISTYTICSNPLSECYPIKEMILSNLQFAEEVVVADFDSIDGTIELLNYIKNDIEINPSKYYGKLKIIKGDMKYENTEYFYAKAKNQALDACTNDWVIRIDADEIIPEWCFETVKNLGKITSKSKYAFLFKRLHFYRDYRTIKVIYNDRRGYTYMFRKSTTARHKYVVGNCDGLIRESDNTFFDDLGIPEHVTVFHYSWCRPVKVMLRRLQRIEKKMIPFNELRKKQYPESYKTVMVNDWFNIDLSLSEKELKNKIFDMTNTSPYNGKHPLLMEKIISDRETTNNQNINENNINENNKNKEQIKRIILEEYRNVLKRDPDPDGLINYIKEIENGLSVKKLHDILITSDEYINKFKNPTVKFIKNKKSEEYNNINYKNIYQCNNQDVYQNTCQGVYQGVYQDVWLNGKCIKKGVKECEKRYNIIKSVVNKYKRPFTLLDIGANIGYFSIRIAEEFPSSCIVAIEPNYSQDIIDGIIENELKNVVVLRKPLNASIIKTLSTCEHFDVTLFLSTLHNINTKNNENNSMEKILSNILQLGDINIVEFATEKQALGDSYQEGIKIINDYKLKYPQIGLINSHLDKSLKRPIYLMEQYKKELKYSRYGKQYPADVSIICDNNKKVFISNHKHEVRDWIQGINLWTFISLDGIYPSRDMIANEIENLDLSECHDIRPWNLIINGNNGNNIHPIDVNDPGHPNVATKKDKEDLTNYIRGNIEYPSKW